MSTSKGVARERRTVAKSLPKTGPSNKKTSHVALQSSVPSRSRPASTRRVRKAQPTSKPARHTRNASTKSRLTTTQTIPPVRRAVKQGYLFDLTEDTHELTLGEKLALAVAIAVIFFVGFAVGAAL